MTRRRPSSKHPNLLYIQDAIPRLPTRYRRSLPWSQELEPMNAGSIEATRELCVDLDNLIELSKESRAPIRALSLIERARADLQAYLDELERTTSASGTH
jgi:hypothetical protein